MRAIQIQDRFDLSALTLVERPDPRPDKGQIVIRTRAASLNYRDLLTVRGTYNPKQRLPLIPLSDGAGVVEAVGEGVTRFKVGDRVAGIFAQGWLAGALTRDRIGSTLGGPHDGFLAERVLLDQDGAVAVPPHLSFEEAACLPCAGVTAWHALTQAKLQPGQTVLVQGTGGVSIFALQLARLFGARVLATSSSDSKLERARKLGAEAGINYKADPQWGKKARALAGGEGVDLIVEVGGVGTLEQSIRCVRPGGTICLIGVLAGYRAELDLTAVLMQNVRIQGVLVGSREHFEDMNRAITAHQLHPVIDKVFPFTEARAAFEHLASQSHFGKVTLSFDTV